MLWIYQATRKQLPNLQWRTSKSRRKNNAKKEQRAKMNRAKSFSPWGKNQWPLKFWLAGPQDITQHLVFTQQVDLNRRLLRVPWTERRSNYSILKEISPEYSLEGLMLKLKLQYFGHLMWRADSLEKALMLGMIEGSRRRDDRGWDGWMASLTQWTWIWARFRSWWWTGKPGVLQFTGSQRVGYNWVTEVN